MQSRTGDEAAAAINAVGAHGRELVLGATGALHLTQMPELGAALPDLASRMQAEDMANYLPDDILTKVDRCAMAVSLETRVPLHRPPRGRIRLVAAARRCGADASRRRCSNRCCSAICPWRWSTGPSAAFRCRSGNGWPGPLRGWAEDLLAPDKLAAEGLLDTRAVQTLWRRHLDKREQNATALWNILMLRAWSERWLKP